MQQLLIITLELHQIMNRKKIPFRDNYGQILSKPKSNH